MDPEIRVEAIKQTAGILIYYADKISGLEYGLSVSVLKLLVDQNERLSIIKAAVNALSDL